MERELEKTLMEIDHLIKVHEERGNTHTQSVLEQSQEIIGMCAKAARTPSDLKEILERDTAKKPVQTEDGMVCPICGSKAVPWSRFCDECGQRWLGRGLNERMKDVENIYNIR